MSQPVCMLSLCGALLSSESGERLASYVAALSDLAIRDEDLTDFRLSEPVATLSEAPSPRVLETA